MTDIVERLRARQVTNWVHATGQTPRASGKRTDPLCAAAADEIERLRAEVAGLREDAERLEFIQNEYLHIIPFAMPTGADDSEVGWQVHIEAMNPADGFRHTEYRDNLRAAIDAARKGTTPTPQPPSPSPRS